MPINTIEHFTHPGHKLAEFNADKQFLCDGCKTPGSGKRYRCHGCDFDLHDYCGTCLASLSSFMHPHKLSLVMHKARGDRNNRVCNVCWDTVEGLVYRCNDCDFDLHPMCSQLPEKLKHVLHQAHPLRLEAPSESGLCAVCGHGCASWRYRCGKCGFDIHLECVLVTCQQTTQRGIPQYVPPPPFHPPPGFHPPPPPYFAYAPPPHGGFPYGFPYGPPPAYNMYQNNWAQQPQQVNGAGPGGLGKRIFAIVEQIGLGVASNFIFGMDFTSFFAY